MVYWVSWPANVEDHFCQRVEELPCVWVEFPPLTKTRNTQNTFLTLLLCCSRKISAAETLTQIWKCCLHIPPSLVAAEFCFKMITFNLLVKEDVLVSNTVNRLLWSYCNEMHWSLYRTSSVYIYAFLIVLHAWITSHVRKDKFLL